MITFNFVLLALAVITCLSCTVLLFRGYAASGVRLLLWSALCFVFLTANNFFLVLDLVITHIDFRPWRLGTALIGISFLLYGFIREAE